MKERHPDLVLVDACAAAERDAQRALMHRILPVLQAQVVAVARRTPQWRGHDSRREVSDVVQDVLVELLRNGAQELRRWDPERGLSLEGFVRLVARRYAQRRFYRGRDDRVEPVEPEVLEAHQPAGDHDRVAHRSELGAVLRALYAEMSPRDHELFRRIFLEEQPPAEVAAQLQMTAGALKKWRSRLYQRARRIAEKTRQAPSLRAVITQGDRMSPLAGSAPIRSRGEPSGDTQ